MRDNETDAPVEVQEEDAARYQKLVESQQRCIHCDPTFDNWCNCQCHAAQLGF